MVRFLPAFSLLAIIAGFAAFADDAGLSGYSCYPQEGYESKFIAMPDGGFTCTYTSRSGKTFIREYPNPQRNSSFAESVANIMASDPEIVRLPAKEQRLVAAKKYLKKVGRSESEAASLLEFIDKQNEAEINEGINTIKGDGADEVADTFGRARIDSINESLDETKELSNAPSKKINISSKDLDSHTQNEKTIPSILAGIITLDPYYFADTDGKKSYINNVGEITINPDLISVYYPDHTKDSFLGKYIGKMKDLFFKRSGDLESQVVDFKPTNFMDQQVLGFLAYLTANIHSAYMMILYIVFGAGLIYFSVFTIVRFNWAQGEDYQLSSGGESDGYEQNIKKATKIPFAKFSAIIFSFMFFMAPISKDAVATTGAIGSAIYNNGSTVDSSTEYGYSTGAQVLVRYAVQSGNYFANTLNDYSMRAYIALLNFKMGFVSDGLPRYIGRTKSDVAAIEQQKARLAAAATLYNHACKPYKDGETYRIPKTNSSASGQIKNPDKIAVIGDQTATGIVGALKTKGISVADLTVNNATVFMAKDKAMAAVQSDVDLYVVNFGLQDITSGVFASDIGSDTWRNAYDAALADVILPLKSNGSRVICLAPIEAGDDSSNIKLRAVKDSMQKMCGTTLVSPPLSSADKDIRIKTPTQSGYANIAAYLAPKLGGVMAERMDATGCKELENDIIGKTETLAKLSVSTSDKADTAQGFAENIKEKAPTIASKTGTTDPNQVTRANREVRGRTDFYEHGWAKGERGSFGATSPGSQDGSNNKNGFFRVPMSPENPGWTAIGDVSLYGKANESTGRMEAGTGSTTATGEKIASLAKSGNLVAANWHLPLNTIVAVRSANGQVYHFRTVDRGPLVVFGKKLPNGETERPVAPKSNPWTYSTKFFDLTPTAMEQMCFMTGDRTSFTVVSYNAKPGSNPIQPGQMADGTLKIDHSKCPKKRKLIGQNLARTFGPTGNGDDTVYMNSGGSRDSGIEYIVIDDSAYRNLKDFVQLISFTNNNFGWMSVAMVPTSYEFFKFLNMFYVQDATGRMTSGDEVFAQGIESASHGSGVGESRAGFQAESMAEYLYGDLIVSNSTWFMVPGFKAIYDTVSGKLEKLVFRNGDDQDRNLRNGFHQYTFSAIALGVTAISTGGAGGYASTGDSGINVGAVMMALALVVAKLTKSVVMFQIIIAILSFIAAMAIMTFVISVVSLLLITTIVVVKIIFYLIEVMLFFLAAPAVGMVSAFSDNGYRYFLSFIKKLVMLMIAPLFIIIPGYLFIPVSEMFRGLINAMIRMLLIIFERAAELLNIDGGTMYTIKKITMVSAISGIANILSMIMIFITIFIVLIKFRGWMVDKIGIEQDFDMSGEAFSQTRDKIKRFIAPM